MIRSLACLMFALPVALSACSADWKYADVDGDGLSPADGDCWDEAEGPEGSAVGGELIFPGAVDDWYDGVDANCGLDDDFDADVDSYVDDNYVGLPTYGVDGSGALPGGDCDDTLADVNPAGTDVWYDGVDTNCSSNDDYDQDSDGYVPAEYGGLATQYVDGSGALGAQDCDDDPSDDAADCATAGLCAADVNPDATDAWYDGVDADCQGNCDYDQDGDTYIPRTKAGLTTIYAEDACLTTDEGGTITLGDCDDLDELIYYNPSIEEVWYNGVDENCDDNDGDQDNDLYWADDYDDLVTANGGTPLTVPTGFDGDCWDDPDALPGDMVAQFGWDQLDAEEVYPTATDRNYDGIDQACDGATYEYDQDGDGEDAEYYGGTDCVDGSVSPSGASQDDDNPAGLTNSAIRSGAIETWYDGTDQDCDDASDYDADGDGHDVEDFGGDDCIDGGSYDDSNPGGIAAASVYEGATETWYDGTDQDCENDDDYDADADGYVPDAYAGETTPAAAGSGSLPDGDCDESTSTGYPINPGASDIVDNGIDEDCSGGDLCYNDDDNDGYLDSTGDTIVSTDLDCDDNYEGERTDPTTDCSDNWSTCTTSCADTDGDSYADCRDLCLDVDGDNYGTTNSSASSCTDATGASCAADTACTSTDLDDAKSTCTTSLTDTDGDGYYNCQDQCADVDGDNYGTTSTAAASCVTNGASGGTTTCAADAACTGVDLDDNKSTCTTSIADGDSDGYYNCQDLCLDVDGDNYGTSNASASSCVTNGASGGTTSCVQDALCTSTDLDDNKSTCTTSIADNDSDGYYDCQDLCLDVDGDNYGTSNSSASSCVTNGASGGTTSCAQDATCTSTDLDDAKSTCTTSLTDTDGDGVYNCQDQCADVDGDNYGTTSTAAAACVTNGASGGTTSCAGDAACTSTDLDDAKSTCTTTIADGDSDGYYNCQDLCLDVDGDNYGTSNASASSCVTNGASGGTTTCAQDALCTSTDADDAKSTCTTSITDGDGDGYYNCQDLCLDVDGDNYGTSNSSASSCVTNGASGGTTTCAQDALCTGTDLDDAKSTCTTSIADNDSDTYYDCQDLCLDVDGDNYGTSNSSASSCVTNGASGGSTSCVQDALCTSTDLDDAKSTCTTSIADGDGDGYYNCQDQCEDVDGDNYGTTSTAAAACVTNGASGGSTSCAQDAACTAADLDDNKSTCTTSLTDGDSDGYYNCQDLCLDVDGDNYGTSNASASSCVTNGASGGTTTCAQDALCTSTDLDDAKSTCTTSVADTDGDTYYDCQDLCLDVDGDNYGTSNASASSCVTNGASGGSTTCAQDATCTGTDLDDAKSTCTTSLTDTDGDGVYNCQDQCADVDGDNYGTTSTAAAACVTNGASGGTTTCAGDAACTSTDLDDAKSTCTTSIADGDSDGFYNCQDLCLDVDGDNYGTSNASASSCVTNGASGGTTTCAKDAVCLGTDCLDTVADNGAYTFVGAASESPGVCMTDADEDGYGSDSPATGVTAGTDCDDGWDLTYPDADDDYATDGGVDNDCDGYVDEDVVVVGDLIITEMQIFTSTGIPEWFEVYNNSGRTLYLDGWTFGAIDSSDVTVGEFCVASGEVELDAGEYVIFCGANTIGALNCDYNFIDGTYTDFSASCPAVDSAFVLDDVSGDLYIEHAGLGSTLLIDDVDYIDSAWPFSQYNSMQFDFASLAVDADLQSANDTAANWCAPHSSEKYDTGTPNLYGTPGEATHCP
jgi:Putative metal-binding motif